MRFARAERLEVLEGVTATVGTGAYVITDGEISGEISGEINFSETDPNYHGKKRHL